MRNRLKELRESKGMTQEELAEKAGVARQTVWNLENRPDVVTKTRTIEALARALGIRATDFFTESG